MGEMRLLGSRQMLERLIPDEAKEVFDLDVTGGDTKIIWNPRDGDEVKNAKETFEKLTKGRFKAFKVGDGGDKGEEIKSFDPEVGKLILAPPMAGG